MKWDAATRESAPFHLSSISSRRVGVLNGLLCGRCFCGLLLKLDNARCEWADKKDVPATGAGHRKDGLDGTRGGESATIEFAELEDRVLDLPVIITA